MSYRILLAYLIAIIVLLKPILSLASDPPVLFETPLSSRIANYEIKVTLDEKLNLLNGRQKLLWYNKTQSPSSELQFHLYLNGFRNSESTWLKEARKRHGDKLDDDKIWGFIDITRFSARHLTDKETSTLYRSSNDWPKPINMLDLTSRITFHHPDDNNMADKTVIRIALDNAIQPGAAVLIDLDFIARLPSPPIDRTGAKEEYFFVAQWFPKIGVLEKDGWNCHQFHLESEFFADFGTYDVWMEVPEDHIVGATGVEVSTELKDQRKTYYYHAEDVHDFAWTSSPEFVEFTGQSQDVEIRVLMQPDHQAQGMRHLDAAVEAIRYFQDWYGDYPFPNLTVIDPRRGAGASGGMEYPTLITIGTSYGLPSGIRMPENIIIHEFAHNYWYHLLASNEFEESWLDEGMATYTEILVSKDLYGEVDSVDFLGFKLNNLQGSRIHYMGGRSYDPTVKNTWEYYSPGSFSVNSYSKPGIFLITLHNYLGPELMQQIMRTYVQRFSFKHPSSHDFVALASEVAKQDLTWFFDQALYTNKTLDYAVSDIESYKIDEPKGMDYTLSLADIRSDRANEEEQSDEASGDEAMYHSIVSIRRLGDFVFPVEIKIAFEDGEVIQERWDGRSLWVRYDYTKSSKLQSATVDPDNKIPLDINLTNNSLLMEPDMVSVMVQAGSWLERLQVLAELLSL